MSHTETHDAATGVALMGFVAGFIGGAVIALLYAPSSGRDTRAYLASQAREKGDRIRETAVQQGREVVDQGRAAFERGREAVSSAMSEGREAYRQTKEAI